jgi:hypothetical protein
MALDWFDLTDQDAAVELLRIAPLHAQYELKLPPGWRDLPTVRQAATARLQAATAAGLTCWSSATATAGRPAAACPVPAGSTSALSRTTP